MEVVVYDRQTSSTEILRRSGFTLVELLVVIGLIAMIGALSAPVYQNFQTRTDVDIAAATITNSFRLAQAHAMDMVGDEAWGVRIGADSIIVFQGASYATRNATFDDVYTIAESVQLTGITEVVFSKMYGIPSTTGSVTMQDAGRNVTISLNSLGIVSY